MKRTVLPALLSAMLLLPASSAVAAPDAELLFGMGPTADAGLDADITGEAPVNMLTTWFNGSEDLGWLQFWQDSLIPDTYGDGYAHHLIVYSEGLEQPGVSTPGGTACGQPYPVSDGFVDDMEQLADIFVGDGPLYVTFFSEFQTYVCEDSQWAGNENYFEALKDNFRAGAEIFRAQGDDVYVSFGPWGGWQHQWDDPSVGGGRSLIPYFADVMGESDFQSFQAMDSDIGSNPQILHEMTDLLAPYGPVMLAHYLPDDESAAVWDADIDQIFTDDNIRQLTDAGLFAFSFMDPLLLDDPDRSARAAEAVSAYAADWIVPPSLTGDTTPPIDEEEPVDDEEPVEDEPVDEEPVDEQPTDEEPVEEEPVEEEPVDEQPVDEQPVEEEPVDEEPVDEQPVDEQPIEDEPVDEEPDDRDRFKKRFGGYRWHLPFWARGSWGGTWW